MPAAGSSGASPTSCNRRIAVFGAIADRELAANRNEFPSNLVNNHKYTDDNQGTWYVVSR